jgi:hypothetical protein
MRTHPNMRNTIVRSKKYNWTNDLASALREIGRRVERGMPTTNPAFAGLLAQWNQKRPADGVRLQALLDAAEEDTARKERESALEHYRAAIELVCDRDRVKEE